MQQCLFQQGPVLLTTLREGGPAEYTLDCGIAENENAARAANPEGGILCQKQSLCLANPRHL